LAELPATGWPLDPAKDVQIFSHFTDAEGHFHLLGQLTNSRKHN